MASKTAESDDSVVQGGTSNAPSSDNALSPAIRVELLNAAAWKEGLETFARATNLAVKLVGSSDEQLGECINPQPLWKLLRTKRQDVAGGCPFDIGGHTLCTCMADAEQGGGPVIARSPEGLAHVTVALLLGGQLVGILLAGQVFDRYPDQWQLEQLAKKLGLDPYDVWQVARREKPVKAATLLMYGNLLRNLGDTFLQTRYDNLLESQRLQETISLRDQAVAENAERRKAEVALKESNRHKDEFLAMLAHELRNPLAPIGNGLQLIELSLDDRQRLEEIAGMMKRQVHQMVRLIDDLLDVSRITRGKMELQKSRVELRSLIEQAIETCRPAIDSAEHTLTVELSPEPIHLDADAIRIIQIVCNLLNNAVKYTPAGGSILLSAMCQGDRVFVSVRDSGVGIAPEMLDQVFEMFVQADRCGKNGLGGLGIGLTLVKTLVELHGGKIRALSQGLGMGSEFQVQLPLATIRQNLSGEDHPKSPGATPSRTFGLQILVVDDNHDSASSLGALLKHMGNDVRVVYDGPSALREVRRQRPDLVLLDLGMPGMSGYEVARELRSDPSFEDLMLVALTGWGQAEDRKKTKQAGFNFHLVKPLEANVLAETLNRVAIYRSA